MVKNMTINKTNVQIINTREMHLHDDTFCGFNYDYANDELTLSLISWGTQKPKTIIFKRVLGFVMTACDFWAPSNRMDCWYAAVNDDNWLLKRGIIAIINTINGNTVFQRQPTRLPFFNFFNFLTRKYL
ncbi:MAG: hypothetical protein IJX80_00820 [Clostridia bacterium]|nr:hypothetical protein [Clostridia bacterium]